jgi:hypothetical protein
MESLNRKNAKHRKQTQDNELHNHKWRLGLCRSNCFQGWLESCATRTKEFRYSPTTTFTA